MAELTSQNDLLNEHVEKFLTQLLPIFKPIFKRARKNNWKSFDDYMDFWGAAINAVVEEGKEIYKKVTGEEYINDSSEDGSGEFLFRVNWFLPSMQWLSKLKDYSRQNNIDPNEPFYRNIIKDIEANIPDEFEVRAPWHGHADKGYPEFDGNPFKKLMSHLAADSFRKVIKDYKEIGGLSDAIAIAELALEAKCKNFDEYLELWGKTVSMLKEREEARRIQLRQQQ